MEKIKMNGLGLVELWIASALASLLLLFLLNTYGNFYRQFVLLIKTIKMENDFHFLTAILRKSIRQAGFTPCGNIENLVTRDTRQHQPICSFSLKNNPTSLQISYLNTFQYTTINHLFAARLPPGPLLIGDCWHAELHNTRFINGHYRLEQPIYYDYEGEIYYGPWLEETFSSKRDHTGGSIFLQQHQHTEQLVQGMEFLAITTEKPHLITIRLGLSDQAPREIVTRLRNEKNT